MKKLIFVLVMIISSGANAINLNIGFPVSAARLGLSGEVDFLVDCSTKNVTIQESTNDLFSRHILRNVSVICYKDNESHKVKMSFKKDLLNQNMLARQHNRYFEP